jgi:hypothetical protein
VQRTGINLVVPILETRTASSGAPAVWGNSDRMIVMVITTSANNFAKVDLGLDIPGNMPQAIPMIKPAESKSAFIAFINNFCTKIPYKSHYY